MDAIPGSPPTVESLLEHADWVRALAQTLVRDPDREDDVVQETWLSALESPPRDATNPRGWLGAVVRNAVRQRARSDERRLAREAASARTEAQDDTADLVAKAALQRELVGHLVALDEPYRTTVLLRFFEGLEASAIAERAGIPLPTVRSRLQRALEQLRRRLDSAYGDRRAWTAMFLPLATVRRVGQVTAGSSAVAIVLGLAWKLALIAVIAGGGVRWIVGERKQPSPIEVVASEPPSDPLTAERTSGAVPASHEPSGSERSMAATKAAPVPVQLASLSTISISGLVVDPRGRLLADLPIRARDRSFPRLENGELWVGNIGEGIDDKHLEELRGNPFLLDEYLRHYGNPPGLREVLMGTDLAGHGRTSRDGAFRLDVPGSSAAFEIESDDWTLVGNGRALGRDEWIFVAAPAVTVSGIVVGQDSIPVEDARLDVDLALSSLPDFPLSLYGGSTFRNWTAQTDARGSFRFVGIACAGGTSIRALFRDGASGSVAVPDRSVDDVRIVLKPTPRQAQPILRGVVVDETGAAVEGADVRLGQNVGRSDAQGAFEIRVTYVGPETPLTATHAGRAAAVIDDFEQRIDMQSSGLDGVVLRMGGAPETIRGRILDAGGGPCVGWFVDLEDGTPFGTVALNIERATTGRDGEMEFAKTDEQGRFLLEGLRARPYRVRAWSQRECLVLVGDPVDAGRQDLELRLPRDARIPRLVGRVVGQRGEPLRDTIVSVSITLFRRPRYEQFIQCKSGRTDSDGRFEIEDVPRRNAFLSVRSAILDEPKHFEIPTEDGSEVRIPANVICRFRLRLRENDPAESFAVLDEHGKTLFVTEYKPDFESTDRSIWRENGQFPVCSVAETAATIVLYGHGEELRRVQVQLSVPDLQFLDL